MKSTAHLRDLGQSLWLDNITRSLLPDGLLRRYIDELSVMPSWSLNASGTLPMTAESQWLINSEATEPTSGLSPAALAARLQRWRPNNKQKCHLITTLFLLIAWLPAFSGCSSLEGTGGNPRVTIRLLKSIEQEHEKPANPPVHPGQPFIMFPDRILGRA